MTQPAAENPLRRTLHSGDVRLSALDYGGAGPPIILLHGLAGHAGEWARTASWLTRTHHVIALDQRGHGQSTRNPTATSRSAFVADVIACLDAYEIPEAVLIGQSLGGHTAFLVAAKHPDRVRRLVVAEANPTPDRGAPEAVRAWLASWPVPFASREAARDYFDRGPTWAEAWASGLEERPDGLWPAFSIETLVRALQGVAAQPHWDAWREIRCPTLIVRGEFGLSHDEASRMAAELDAATVVTVAGAEHDVHLEQPERWREAIEAALA